MYTIFIFIYIYCVFIDKYIYIYIYCVFIDKYMNIYNYRRTQTAHTHTLLRQIFQGIQRRFSTEAP